MVVMIRILLACNAGMSTSLLVKKMQEAAMQQHLEAEIWAVPEAELFDEWTRADFVLLGPQIGYMKDEIEEIIQGKIPVQVIDMKDYGRMDGTKVLLTVIEQLGSAS